MHRRTPSRRPEELERRAPDEQPARPPAADAVLAFQRSAGNHAVSSLLARAPDTAKPKEKPKETAPTGSRATLPDIGTIPLLSVQFGGPPPTRNRREKDEKSTSGEIVVTSQVGAHSQQLLKLANDGKAMKVEVVVPGGQGSLRLELKGAIVSGYSLSESRDGAIEQWTLQFESVEDSVEQDATE